MTIYYKKIFGYAYKIVNFSLKSKETLPYSRHKYNTTFVICMRHPSRDGVSQINNIHIFRVSQINALYGFLGRMLFSKTVFES